MKNKKSKYVQLIELYNSGKTNVDELNKEFKVLDTGAKIQIVLYNIWDNEKVNIKDYSTNLAAYDFVTE